MPTILVADDNSNIQKMVGIALKDQGIDVIAVGNGEAAVRKLAESVPDLILADIFMPVRNGYEVCEYVKKDDRFAHVPVVLLVGAFDPLDDREVERVRADAVLKKPFVPPEPLIEMVKSLLGKAAAAAPAAEDVEQTQDVTAGVGGRTPTGTIRMPAPTERTQRLEPEPEAAGAPRSGTVEIPRPEIPPTEKTQRLSPEELPGAPAGAEGFKLDLAEPPAPPQEKTQQLSATDISKILSRESALTPPPSPETEEEEFALPPSVVEFRGEETPVAFEDMLRPTEEEEEAEEEPKGELGAGAFEAAEEPTPEEAADEAAIRFGGIREEAKTPDPDLPPIPVDFGHSEPAEIITEEHAEASGVSVGPAEDLVSSSSGWAASTATEGSPTGAAEPGLEHERTEGFLTPPPAPARGIASEAVAPAPEFAIPAAAEAGAISAEEFEETAELPKHILQEEVNRAQEIAARIAAQNRELIAKEEAAGTPAGVPGMGPGIEKAMSAADTILARHRAQVAAGEEAAASAAAAAPAIAPAAPAPVEAAAPEGPERRAAEPALIEAISERVLAQLDPYIIEKISKEIVRPIVEAMIRKELEKLE